MGWKVGNSIVSKVYHGAVEVTNSFLGEYVDPIDSIPNLIVRLDATTVSDGTDFITTTGQPVINWKNKVNNTIIGAERIIVAQTPTTSIVGGKMEVQFDGNDYLALTDDPLLNFAPGDSFTIFVLSGSNTPGAGTLVEKGPSDNREYGVMWYYNAGANITSFLWGGQFQGGGIPESRQQYPQIVTFKYDDSINQHKIWVDGILDYTATPVTFTTPGIGYRALIGARDASGVPLNNPGYFLTGAIRMVLIYNRSLSDSEILQVETELNNYK